MTPNIADEEEGRGVVGLIVSSEEGLDCVGANVVGCAEVGLGVGVLVDEGIEVGRFVGTLVVGTGLSRPVGDKLVGLRVVGANVDGGFVGRLVGALVVGLDVGWDVFVGARVGVMVGLPVGDAVCGVERTE